MHSFHRWHCKLWKFYHICICILLTSMCAELLSHVWLFAAPWTLAWQPLLSMEFSRQEYWSHFLVSTFYSRGLPNPGMKPAYLMCPALTAGFFTTVPLRKSKYVYLIEIRAEWSMSLNENTSKAEWHLITFQFIKSNQHQLVYIYQIIQEIFCLNI